MLTICSPRTGNILSRYGHSPTSDAPNADLICLLLAQQVPIDSAEQLNEDQTVTRLRAVSVAAGAAPKGRHRPDLARR